jgi:GNAT superfamily N-acetyltransferase
VARLIELRVVPRDHAADLRDALKAEVDAVYGEPGSGAPPPEGAFDPPTGLFLVAYVDGDATGCGGFQRHDDATAELNNMYVAPAARGTGVGRAILDALLEGAREAGYAAVRLETGNRQHRAIALYERAGFATIPCWGPFATDPKSLCLERRLD